ncbi:urea transporter [Cryomyces antarcticus]
MGIPSFQASNAIVYITYEAFLFSKAECFPFALNSIALALGSGMLFYYPEISTICGVQGLVVYVLSSSCRPEGFVLTEWARHRYGVVTALFLSLMTLVTLFLHMCAFTTIYTSLGNFKVSFITGNIQGAMVVGLVIIGVIAFGFKTNLDRKLMIYILPVAILTNDFFILGFWLRTFASCTDKDLWIGTSVATVAVTIILTLVGALGLLLPAWVVGIVLVMVVSLSTAAFDSLQGTMVITGSNDLFRNNLDIWWVKASVVLIIIPAVAVALKSPDILQIYLLRFEVVVGGLGGLLTVFIFGTIYYGNPTDGAKLLLLENGLYAKDWSVFDAFVAAPIGGLTWAFSAFALRIAFQCSLAKAQGQPFEALVRPVLQGPRFFHQ